MPVWHLYNMLGVITTRSKRMKIMWSSMWKKGLFHIDFIRFHTFSHMFHMLFSHACETILCERGVKGMWKSAWNHVILFTCFFTHNFTHFLVLALPETNVWKSCEIVCEKRLNSYRFHTVFTHFHTCFTSFSCIISHTSSAVAFSHSFHMLVHMVQ